MPRRSFIVDLETEDPKALDGVGSVALDRAVDAWVQSTPLDGIGAVALDRAMAAWVRKTFPEKIEVKVDEVERPPAPSPPFPTGVRR
jgi:hypothetical protein